MKKRIFAKVSGIVQGVGFRYFVYKMAVKLNLDGWTRNNYNTNIVEVEAEGEEENLIAFIENLKKGNSFSRVDNVEVEWFDSVNEFKGFKIK